MKETLCEVRAGLHLQGARGAGRAVDHVQRRAPAHAAPRHVRRDQPRQDRRALLIPYPCIAAYSCVDDAVHSGALVPCHHFAHCAAARANPKAHFCHDAWAFAPEYAHACLAHTLRLCAACCHGYVLSLPKTSCTHPAGADRAEYLIVHGSYLLCYADVTLKWRIGGAGKLQGLDPIHPDRLADQHAAELLAEQVTYRRVRCWKFDISAVPHPPRPPRRPARHRAARQAGNTISYFVGPDNILAVSCRPHG